MPTVTGLCLCLVAIGHTAALKSYLEPAPALDNSALDGSKNEFNPAFNFAESLGLNPAVSVMNAVPRDKEKDDDSSYSSSRKAHHVQGSSHASPHEPYPLGSVSEDSHTLQKLLHPEEDEEAKAARKKKMVKYLVLDVVNDYVASGKVFLKSMLKDVVKAMDKAFATEDDEEFSENTAEELLAEVWDEEDPHKKKGRHVTDTVHHSTHKSAANLLVTREREAQQMMREAKRLMAAAEAANTDVAALKVKMNENRADEEEQPSARQGDQAESSARQGDQITLSLLSTGSSRTASLNDIHEAWHDMQHARQEAKRAHKAVVDEEMSPYKNEEMLEEFRMAENNAKEELKHRLAILKSYREHLHAHDDEGRNN